MSKNTKKKSRARRHKTERLDILSPDELQIRGENLLAQEKFQQAISCFKELLKIETTPRSLAGMERAYRGRIAELSGKSMFKEALILLQALEQRCPEAEVESLRMVLMLQSGKYGEGIRLYSACRKRLSGEQIQRVEALLGALLLADPGLQTADVEADSPAVRFYPQAAAAVHCFCTGQATQLQEALRQIPFRSPYRDLRILLSGLNQLHTDSDNARKMLNKIEEDSPYFQSAFSYLARISSPQEFLAHLRELPSLEHKRFRELCGISQKLFNALEELSKSQNNPLQLYHLMRRHRSCFSDRMRLSLLKAIAPFCGIHVVDILENVRGIPLPEKIRLVALAAETEDAPAIAVAYWADYLEYIDPNEPAAHRKIALVLRRKAELMTRNPFEFSKEATIDSLLESLEHDPTHVQTWLKAAELAGLYQSQNRQYGIINDAVKSLPDNVPILLAAMKAGGQRGAHKKAAGLASRVLQLDPINTTALDFLVESRLNHGRKLALQQKWELAEKELQGADTRVRAIRFRGRNRICLGMVQLLQNNDDGLQLIDTGCRENGFPILGRLLTALEARLYKLPASWRNRFDKELRQSSAAQKSIDSQEFLRIISWLNGFSDKERLALREICLGLKSYFSVAADSAWDLKEGLEICKALAETELNMALLKCAKRLRNQYPSSLECQVWYIVSGALKSGRPLSWQDSDEIEDLLRDLEAQGKYPFVEYIDNLIIEKHLAAMHLPGSDDFFDDDDSLFDPIEDLFGPFGPPKKLPQEIAPPENKKTRPPARQLNLFDDEE